MSCKKCGSFMDDYEFLPYPFSETPTAITSDVKTSDVLVDVMDVDGNRYRDVVKVSLEPTVISLRNTDKEE